MNNYNQKGYTLIELLAVTAIVVIVSGLIAGILFSTLRGGNKSKVTNEVAQNGNYAISVISNTITKAEDIAAVNGIPIDDCTEDVSTGIEQSISLVDQEGKTITFVCEDDTISSQSGNTTFPLIDNTVVEVSSGTCSFVCRQSDDPYAIPIIDVSFGLSQRSEIQAFENQASASFNTSVSLRNYDPK